MSRGGEFKTKFEKALHKQGADYPAIKDSSADWKTEEGHDIDKQIKAMEELIAEEEKINYKM